MKHFFRGGGELSVSNCERVNMSTSYQDLSIHPVNTDDRLLSPIGRTSIDIRSGEGLYSPCGRSLFDFPSKIDPRLAINPSVNVSQSIEKRKPNDDGAPNKYRKEGGDGVTTMQGDSALVLPLFDACSTNVPVFYHRALIATVPGSDCRSEPRRSAVGAQSEKSRTWLGLGRYIVGFLKGPRTKVELALTQAKTKDELGMNYQRTRNEVGVNHSQYVKAPTTPLDRLRTVYAKQRQLKSTCLKHESYIVDTCSTHVQHMNDTSITHERDMNDTSNAAVSYQQGNGAVVDYINDLRVNRLILECFRVLCEEFRVKVESVVINEEIKAQNGLKSVVLKICILSMLFCVLFSVTVAIPAFGQEAVGLRGQRLIKGRVEDKLTATPIEGVKISVVGNEIIAFSDQNGCFELPIDDKNGAVLFSFPGFMPLQIEYVDRYLEDKLRVVKMIWVEDKVAKLKEGDSIPTLLRNMRLPIFNHPTGRTHISLEEYSKKKLLIIDFWAPWCKPCVEAMDKWNQMMTTTSMRDIAVLGVNVGGFERSLDYMKARKWKMPSVYGKDFIRLNNYFFTESQVGGQVWLFDGKVFFIGFGKDRKENRQRLESLLFTLNGKEGAGG